jgi:hypothetical protein
MNENEESSPPSAVMMVVGDAVMEGEEGEISE